MVNRFNESEDTLLFTTPTGGADGGAVLYFALTGTGAGAGEYREFVGGAVGTGAGA